MFMFLWKIQTKNTNIQVLFFVFMDLEFPHESNYYFA